MSWVVTVAAMRGHRDVVDEVPGLRRLAQRQLDVVRRDQLRDLGITRFHVRAQVAARRWQTLGPSLVVLSTGRPTRAQELVAGPLHCGPDAWLTGWTALERAGLQGWLREGVHVVVPHGSRPPPLDGLTIHQARNLDAADLVPGIPRCVTPARAAIDAAGSLASPRSASGLVLAVAQQKLATASEMLEVLERIWRVKHTAVLREVLADASGSDSRGEHDVYRIARSVGFSDVTRQARIQTPSGTWPVDLLLVLSDGRRVVVEVDGPSHDDPRQRMADAERDLALTALGYHVIRFPAALVRADPASVRARLTTLWRSQGAL